MANTCTLFRKSFCLGSLLSAGAQCCKTIACLSTGPTGTGKTSYVKATLGALPKAAYCNVHTAFSAQTSARQVQDIINARLEKRRKGVYGPPFGSRCVVFVDDINLSAPEAYGAQVQTVHDMQVPDWAFGLRLDLSIHHCIEGRIPSPTPRYHNPKLLRWYAMAVGRCFIMQNPISNRCFLCGCPKRLHNLI
jgi:P-loop containing dynein motor region